MKCKLFQVCMIELPLLAREELFVPPDEVDEAEGDVVIWWGEESTELRPPKVHVKHNQTSQLAHIF